MSDQSRSILDQVVSALQRELGDNLYSCCVYGSAVRGNAIEGVSDLNLLILLNVSNPQAHLALARALESFPQVDPFVLARRGFQRSVRSFAAKFSSIRRHYRVLHGADPLVGMEVDVELLRFLCEQGIRNLRLRLVYAFVSRGRLQRYPQFLIQNVTPFLVHASEALRLEGIEIPKEFAARIPVLERELRIDGAILTRWLELKRQPRKFTAEEIAAWHGDLFPVVDALLIWVETRWKL